MYEKNSNFGAPEECLSASAEQNFAHPAMPIGPHDDKVGPAIARRGRKVFRYWSATALDPSHLRPYSIPPQMINQFIHCLA